MPAVDCQYEFEVRPHRSVQRIAKEIAGAAGSGPVFFGFKSIPTTKLAAKKGTPK
jgi:hypothetical protein